jgi:hypothetical protein
MDRSIQIEPVENKIRVANSLTTYPVVKAPPPMLPGKKVPPPPSRKKSPQPPMDKKQRAAHGPNLDVVATTWDPPIRHVSTAT